MAFYQKLHNNILDSGIRFNLSNQIVSKLKKSEYAFGFSESEFGKAVYYRSYSRKMNDGSQETWPDTVVRVINGVFTIRKWWYLNHGLDWNDDSVQPLAFDMALSMLKMQWLPPGRGLWAMGTDYVYERGSLSLYNCFSGDTEFYANEQVVKLKDCVGEEIKVLNNEGFFTDATVKSFGTQELQKVVFKPSGLRTNYKISYDVTKDHRWILEDGTETTSIKVGDTVRSNCFKGIIDKSHFDYVNGYGHGMIYGDGTQQTLYKDRFTIRLCGDKNNYKEIIESHCRYRSTCNPPSYGGDPVITLVSPKVNLKAVPQIESILYIRGFIDGWTAMDSWDKKNSNSRCLDTSDSEAKEWFLKYAPMVGYNITGLRYEEGETNYGYKKLYRISYTTDTVKYRVNKIIDEGKEEEVFCVVEPKTKTFTLAGGLLTGNCAFVEVNDIVNDVAWLMNGLMNGCGVGFGIPNNPKIHMAKPAPARGTVMWTVPDSREGWVESVRLLIDSYVKELPTIKFNYDGIRKYGEPIVGFGGTASGAGPLVELHDRIRLYCKQFIEHDINETLLIANICNAVGCCVVAGNVRRSAEICMGSPDDEVFINLKNYDVYPERANIGWMSNNSIRLSESRHFMKIPQIAESILTRGEPAIVNMINVQNYGRLRLGEKNPDPATGFNPCGEIPLEDKEVCNLAEGFPSRCRTKTEFSQAVKYATYYSSTVTLYPTTSEETNRVIARNRRIGVSLSGIADWFDTWGYAKCVRWLREGYKIVKEVNRITNEQAGVPPSIRLTTVKPSGTISQVTGVSPGMHYPTYKYAIRRMIVDKAHPLYKLLKNAQYDYEPLLEFSESEGDDLKVYEKYMGHPAIGNRVPLSSETSVVFEFPIHQGNSRPANEVSAWEQFAQLAMLQREWSDNSVSCTVYFDREKEGTQIPQMLAQFAPIVKSVSMLPHSENMYPQMPYEEITKDEYNERIKKLKPVNWDNYSGSDGIAELYCNSDTCELPKELL